jgi:hypothetical protein
MPQWRDSEEPVSRGRVWLQETLLVHAVAFFMAPVPIESYRVQYCLGSGEWEDLAASDHNDALEVTIDDSDLVMADRIRLVTTSRIKLYEIEIMAERADIERGDCLRSLQYLQVGSSRSCHFVQRPLILACTRMSARRLARVQEYWASVDPVAQYGNMYRCHLDNGECQWLCPFHAAQARGKVELGREQLRTVGELVTERMIKIAKVARSRSLAQNLLLYSQSTEESAVPRTKGFTKRRRHAQDELEKKNRRKKPPSTELVPGATFSLLPSAEL